MTTDKRYNDRTLNALLTQVGMD